jgi:pyruvate/2-oxoglutarate dehydrogenase complex dihydrolipoamide dehydrogenase (E3) component
MARIVIQNALFNGRAKASSLIIPWATYTSPEIAHIGLNDKDARAGGIEVDTFTQELAGVDRAGIILSIRMARACRCRRLRE